MCRSFHPHGIGIRHPPSTWMFTHWEALLTFSFQAFREPWLHSYDRSNHWQGPTDSSPWCLLGPAQGLLSITELASE